MENRRPVALITGASSGIGLELAKQFIQHDHDLIVVAENREELEGAALMLRQLADARVDAIVADLSRLDGAPRVFDEVQRLGRDVDVLVNNAAMGVYGKFIETDLDAEIAMVHVNVISYLQLTKFFAPRMAERGAGRILMTASVASKTPIPYLSVYAATKAFVYEFSQALREELRDSGVTVTALLPGPTDTNFFERANMLDSKILDEKLADPADVAKAGFDALMKGDDKVIVPLKYNVQTKLGNVVPDPLLVKQARKKHEPKDEGREEARER